MKLNKKIEITQCNIKLTNEEKKIFHAVADRLYEGMMSRMIRSIVKEKYVELKKSNDLKFPDARDLEVIDNEL